MINDREWAYLAKRVFPARKAPPQAPPYLWTRVLAAIEAKEALLPPAWWTQWTWMGRVAFGTGLAVSLAFVLTSRLPETQNDEVSFDGQTTQELAIAVAQQFADDPDSVGAWVLEAHS